MARPVHGLQVDLATGEGLHNIFDSLGPVDVVINCAAVSLPALCEKHPESARQVLLVIHCRT